MEFSVRDIPPKPEFYKKTKSDVLAWKLFKRDVSLVLRRCGTELNKQTVGVGFRARTNTRRFRYLGSHGRQRNLCTMSFPLWGDKKYSHDFDDVFASCRQPYYTALRLIRVYIVSIAILQWFFSVFAAKFSEPTPFFNFYQCQSTLSHRLILADPVKDLSLKLHRSTEY